MTPDHAVMKELISFTMEQALQYKTFTGAFIVKDGAVIAREMTSIETDKSSIAHAEMKAIAAASKQLGASLRGCVLYTTQKPCVMCASAIAWSGISGVCYGLERDHHWQGAGELKAFLARHGVECHGPVMEDECRKIDQLLIANGL